MARALCRAIASMDAFYLALFSKAYSWSAKHEFDSRPSLYSAVLYISALQFLNMLTGVFLIESFGLRIGIFKWVGGAIPVVIFACNWWWASRNQPSICGVVGKSQAVNAYVVISIMAFIAATIVFVYTAPS